MEFVVLIAALIVLVALAERFGVDSRDTLRSHDAELAARGFTREQRVQMLSEPWTR
jgi:hypothetical protein